MNANTLCNRKIGIYARHSKEDGSSQTITNQLEIMTSYVNNYHGIITEQYLDDGLTGVFFDRPNYLRMINDIKIGKIDTVITKDLSRLGRNYLESGQVIEDFFPRYNVRYIAIGDAFDSFLDTGDFVPIKNVFNEWYVKDISVKTRAAKENAAKQGRFIGSNAPYGYKKSPENKHLLIPDDEVSKIVLEIFELFISGFSARAIADELNKRKLPTPSEHQKMRKTLAKELEKGIIITPSDYWKNTKLSIGWGSGTVTQILDNPVYMGHMAQGKRKNLSYKSKIRLQVSKENWIYIKNTHEAIVDEKTFLNVDMIRKQRNFAKRTRSGEVSLFAGVCYCSNCGSPMVYTSKILKNRAVGLYKCSGYVNKGSHFCKPNQIREDYLIEQLLQFCKVTIADNGSKSKLNHYLLEKLKTTILLLEQEKKEVETKTKTLEDTALKLLRQNQELPLVVSRLLANTEKEMEELQQTHRYIENQLQQKKQKLSSADKVIRYLLDFLLNPIFSHQNIISVFEKITVYKTPGSTRPQIEPLFRV